MRLNQSCALLFLFALTLGPIAAQERQRDSNARGTIRGRVLNESGQPLADVSVSLRDYGSSTNRRQAVTDRDGKFQFDDLAPLVYLISTGLPAYITPARDPDSTVSTTYRVGDNVTLVMIKGGAITGKVLFPSNDPVVGIRVRAQMIRDSFGQRSRYGATTREMTTDDRGVYRIYGVQPGTYVVMAVGGMYGLPSYRNDATTYAPSGSRDTASEVSVQAGQEVSDVDIRYRSDPGYTVSGMASAPQGLDVTGFFVMLTSTVDAGSQLSESNYEQIGEPFMFYGVSDGDYDLTAQSISPSGNRWLSAPKRIRVRGANVTGVELVAKPLASISGRVALEESTAPECKDKRRPVLTETLVSAWHNEKDAGKDMPRFIWSLGAPVYPNRDGEISLQNLAAGQYQIVSRLSAKYWFLKSITLPALQSAKTTDAVGNWITVQSGDRVTGLTVTLAAGAGSLLGQLKVGEGQTLPPRLYVYLVPAERESEKDVLRFFAAPVTPDRKVVLEHLPPGRYLVVMQPALEGATPTLTKLRLPDETETRAKLLREAAQEKVEIQIKPCQNIVDYDFSLKRPSDPK